MGRTRLGLLLSPRLGIGIFSSASLSTTSQRQAEAYKLVVVGGGAGGAAMSAKFGARLGKENVAVVEPSENHFYQPMWTLVGGGLKELQQSRRPQRDILTGATWIQDAAAEFSPESNTLRTEGGKTLKYDFLLMATGVVPNFHAIKGLTEALERSDSGVCSNYSYVHVKRTLPAIKAIQEGDAIFTFPNGPIKCAGAPQKIAYIADDLFRQMGKRERINMRYNTALPAIFGVKHYAQVLDKVAAAKDIEVNTRHALVEVRPDTKEAVFDVLDAEGKASSQKTYKFGLLHASPPCAPVQAVKDSALSNEAGFVSVDKASLRHTNFPNVFGIGDCTDSPNAKTAAAVAAQVRVLKANMRAAMEGGQPSLSYNGYASCPLVTSTKTTIMAEFDYDLQPLETFPIDQAKERRSMYLMKAYLMPELYWSGLVKGWWEGPDIPRKLLHFGMGK